MKSMSEMGISGEGDYHETVLQYQSTIKRLQSENKQLTDRIEALKDTLEIAKCYINSSGERNGVLERIDITLEES